MNAWYEELRGAFSSPLPGWEAQQRMLNYLRPDARQALSIDPDARKGSVLVLIYPREEILHTVLTLRQPYEGTHGGQVSFPGGKPEPGDADLWHTALREAGEEIGVSGAAIQQVGRLTDVYIPPSRFMVSPYVAFTPHSPEFRADPSEVARILEAPLSLFLDANSIGETTLHVQVVNARMKVKYYDVQGETVWGATAMMLSELAEVLKRSPLKNRMW